MEGGKDSGQKTGSLNADDCNFIGDISERNRIWEINISYKKMIKIKCVRVKIDQRLIMSSGIPTSMKASDLLETDISL